MVGVGDAGHAEAADLDPGAVQDEVQLQARRPAREGGQAFGIGAAQAERLPEEEGLVIAPEGVEVAGDDDRLGRGDDEVVQRAQLLLPLAAFGAGIGALLWGVGRLPPEVAARAVGLAGSLVIVTLVLVFLLAGALRRVPVYEVFIDGAKEGFGVAVAIIPYLVAMLVAIGVFRAAGCMDYVMGAIGAAVAALGWNTDFLPALPVGLMKILSGSGARGLMVDVMQTHGVDSFPARLAAIIQGSTETTFYVLAVYFGSVGVKDTRHALGCALIADAVGIVAAIGVAYAFYR